jgi:phosphoribosyl-AMP cyclohydrolase / phosphoribosyl-ATP pyrophosphohydrolase
VSLTNFDPERVDWDKNAGLVPAIVQDADDGRVLMLGYMNREALSATLQSGRVVFYSRSKQRLWQKGESSGHYLELCALRVDCDADTLLVSARPAGPVCHTGTATCFGDVAAAMPLGFLLDLERIIKERGAADPATSYTARLKASGMRRIAQKVGEEGVEVALAACVEDDAALVGECADLLYHLLVLLNARSLSLAPVLDALRARHSERA